MIKRCGQTVKATEPCLVLNCRFFQAVFRSLIVFYSKDNKSFKIKQKKECVFLFDLSSTVTTVNNYESNFSNSSLEMLAFNEIGILEPP